MTQKRKPTRITRKRTPRSTAVAGESRATEPTNGNQRATRTGRPRSYRPAWSPVPDAPPSETAGLSLDAIAPDLLERAVQHKRAWINRFVREGCPRGKLMEYARQYAAAEGLPEEAVPPYSTLNTWVHRLLKHGLPGLVDAPSSRAGRSRTVTGTVEDHFEVAATLGKGPMGILHYLSEALPPGTKLPKYSAVRRALKAFEQREPHLVAMARMGPTWFRDNCEVALSHGVFPGGQRLALDSTVLDAWIKVWCETEWRAFRPVLTVVEDVGSRALVTFNLSLFAIDSGICLGTLGRALNQKQNYPGLMSVRVPYEITLDKGAEHQGRFLAALERLQIEVVPRKDNAPRGGAHVERLIGTITTEVVKNIGVGYSKCDRTFNAYAPADSDTKRNLTSLKYESYKREVPVESLMTLERLEARILAWATVYNERPHPALAVNDPRVQACLAGVKRRIGREHPFTPDKESTA